MLGFPANGWAVVAVMSTSRLRVGIAVHGVIMWRLMVIDAFSSPAAGVGQYESLSAGKKFQFGFSIYGTQGV